MSCSCLDSARLSSTAMALTHVLKEISSVVAFFQSRGDSGGGDITSLQKTFADSTLNKLNTIKDFGTGDAAQLFEALKGDPFGESQTKRIRDSIDVMVQSVSEAPTSTSDGPKQLLKYWWNYFSQERMDFMCSDASINAKMTCVVEVGYDVGLTNPKEETYRWMMATLLALHYKQVPSPQEIWSKVQDLKRAWECERKPFYLDHIQEFPELPEHLPDRIYQHAYASAKPVSVKLSGINTIADSVPLRSNSKLLKKAKTKRETTALADAYASGPTYETDEPVPVKTQPTAVKQELPADSDSDPEIVILRKEFELKVMKIKAAKRCVSQSSAPVVKQEPAVVGHITLTRTADGGVQVAPRVKPEVAEANQAQGESNNEHKKTSHPEAEAEPKKTEPLAPTEADLDPWTRAALEAMNKRNQTKTQTKKDTQASSDGIKKSTQASSDGIKKRPSANMQPAIEGKSTKGAKDDKNKKIKHGTVGKVMKKEVKAEIVKTEPDAKKKVKAGIAEPGADVVPATHIMKSMPKLPTDGSNPKPVKYWGGIIYSACKQKKFRALKVRGDNYSETSSSWGGDKPTADSWRKCVNAIEEHYKKPKTKK